MKKLKKKTDKKNTKTKEIFQNNILFIITEKMESLFGTDKLISKNIFF